MLSNLKLQGPNFNSKDMNDIKNQANQFNLIWFIIMYRTLLFQNCTYFLNTCLNQWYTMFLLELIYWFNLA